MRSGLFAAIPIGRRATGRASLAGALLCAALLPAVVADAQTASSYVVSPASLSFTGMQGGANPPGQNVSLTGASGGAVGWNSVTSHSWLRLSPGSGTTPSTVTVSVVVGTLAAGTHSGTVTFGAKGFVAKTLPVTLTVTAPSSDLIVNGSFESGTGSPWVLAGAAQRVTGGLPHDGANNLSIIGTGTAYQDIAIPSTAQAADLQFFLRVDTNETTSTTPYDTLKVEVRNTSGALLSAPRTFSNLVPVRGAYTREYGMSLLGYRGQTVRLQFSAFNSPTLTTSFRIDDVSVSTKYTAPALIATPSILSFSGYAGGPNPGPQAVGISLSGSGALSWAASDNQPWLSVSPTSGTTPSNTTASVNLAGLAAGSYSGVITVSAVGAGNSPITVAVDLTVTAPPAGPELLANGAFDGTIPWIRVGNAYYTTQGSNAPSGGGYMYLGTTNLANGTVYQTFTIPSTTTTANLSFWMSASTYETPTAGPNDKLFVEVTNTAGTVLATLATYSNPNVTVSSWAARGLFSMLAFKGQTVRLQFRATTDGSNTTSFRIDDVSVK
jgi:hypothetical protein